VTAPPVLPGQPGRGSRRRRLTALGAPAAVLIVVALVLTLRGGGSDDAARRAPDLRAGALRTAGGTHAVQVSADDRPLDSTAAAVSGAVRRLLAGGAPLAPAELRARVGAAVAAAPATPAPAPTGGATRLSPDLLGGDLAGCLAILDPGRALRGVERVSWAGRPALLLVYDGARSGGYDAFVVGAGCDGLHDGLLTYVGVPAKTGSATP